MGPLTMAALGSAASSVIGKGIDALTGGGNVDSPTMKEMAGAQRAAIRGKIEAADKYGISRLYALGAPTMSTGFSTGGSEPTLGAQLSDMGADVSRAVAAVQSDEERALQALTLEKAGLENDFLRAQIQSVNMRTARESGPAYPVIPVTSNPLPGMGGGFLGVQHPGLGQKAENDYSDIGGNIFGGAALVNDSVRDVEAWFRRNFPSAERLEPYLPFNLFR